ncbi:hypothetical protein C0993_010339 [Termitomyces sp. T159_Od127]|nr:hypothetical protein C0993_010339 [Termitomyces sp. T159_Od127]
MNDTETEYTRDDWVTEDTGFDGKDVLTLVRNGNNPFKGWDIELLIKEIEDNLEARVIDIPSVAEGANNYGFHMKLSNSLDILARLARGDVNMPHYAGFPFELQGPEAEFEVETFKLLRSDPIFVVPRMLYYRLPVQNTEPRLSIPKDIAGRRLYVFERTEGEKNIWNELGPDDKAHLLTQVAHIRAALFNFNPPPEFVSKWLFERLYIKRPEVLPTPIAPTREFLVTLFKLKIEEKIGNMGDRIGWQRNATVGPIAFAAKQSLLRLVPHILPKDCDESSLYRFVLEHGDYGNHNMSITMDESGKPLVTCLYDWETGRIVPAMLSDPAMDLTVTLVADENAAPSFMNFEDDASPEDRAEYMLWSEQYSKALYKFAPEYKDVISAGKDARHLWFAMLRWEGDHAEEYFGKLGCWAEKRMKELESIATDQS